MFWSVLLSVSLSTPLLLSGNSLTMRNFSNTSWTLMMSRHLWTKIYLHIPNPHGHSSWNKYIHCKSIFLNFHYCVLWLICTLIPVLTSQFSFPWCQCCPGFGCMFIFLLLLFISYTPGIRRDIRMWSRKSSPFLLYGLLAAFSFPLEASFVARLFL